MPDAKTPEQREKERRAVLRGLRLVGPPRIGTVAGEGRIVCGVRLTGHCVVDVQMMDKPGVWQPGEYVTYWEIPATADEAALGWRHRVARGFLVGTAFILESGVSAVRLREEFHSDD